MYKCISYSVCGSSSYLSLYPVVSSPTPHTDTENPLYPSILLHNTINVQNLRNRSFSTHEIPNIQTLVVSLQDLQSEVMGSTKGKCADSRNREKGVTEVLYISLSPSLVNGKLTWLTILISIACLKGTLRPNVFR
jgi:hypothetical protein